jgi:hypothetical protein
MGFGCFGGSPCPRSWTWGTRFVERLKANALGYLDAKATATAEADSCGDDNKKSNSTAQATTTTTT